VFAFTGGAHDIAFSEFFLKKWLIFIFEGSKIWVKWWKVERNGV